MPRRHKKQKTSQALKILERGPNGFPLPPTVKNRTGFDAQEALVGCLVNGGFAGGLAQLLEEMRGASREEGKRLAKKWWWNNRDDVLACAPWSAHDKLVNLHKVRCGSDIEIMGLRVAMQEFQRGSLCMFLRVLKDGLWASPTFHVFYDTEDPGADALGGYYHSMEAIGGINCTAQLAIEAAPLPEVEAETAELLVIGLPLPPSEGHLSSMGASCMDEVEDEVESPPNTSL